MRFPCTVIMYWCLELIVNFVQQIQINGRFFSLYYNKHDVLHKHKGNVLRMHITFHMFNYRIPIIVIKFSV